MMKMERILSRPDVRLRRGAGATLLRDSGDVPLPMPVPDQPPFPLHEQVLWELRILGFSHSGHPLDAWDGELPARLGRNGDGGKRIRSTHSFEIRRHIGRKVTFVGWLVTTRRAVTKRHEYMEFMTLEDRHGVVEAVVFPDVYRRYGRRIGEAGCYRVLGEVKEQHGSVSLVADEVEILPIQ
jgi:error-prone DNA polymerase